MVQTDLLNPDMLHPSHRRFYLALALDRYRIVRVGCLKRLETDVGGNPADVFFPECR
jgi:hypothetical protein